MGVETFQRGGKVVWGGGGPCSKKWQSIAKLLSASTAVHRKASFFSVYLKFLVLVDLCSYFEKDENF